MPNAFLLAAALAVLFPICHLIAPMPATLEQPKTAHQSARTAEGYADARPLVRGELARAMAPRVVEWPDVWADKNRMMPEGVGPFAGQRWDTNRTPYLREPMRAYADPDLRLLAMMFGSQTGKTEVLSTAILWQECTAPCWFMVGLPSIDKAKEINERRIQPSIKASPAILAHLAGGRDSMSLRSIEFKGGGLVMWNGAGSDTQAKSTPAPRVALDESEETDAEFRTLMYERVKSFPESKIIDCSTPKNEGEGIDATMAGCQLHEHSVPCPHCQKYFALTFDLLHWGGEFVGPDGEVVVKRGSACTPEEAEATTRVACPNCGQECYDHHKAAMLARGVWLVEGERAEWVGEPGEPVAGIAMGEKKHVLPASADGRPLVVIHDAQPKRAARGYRLNSLYSGMLSWGRFVYDFAHTYGYTITPGFKRGYLAEPWAPAGDKPQVEELRSICEAGTYRLRSGGQRAGETVRAPLPQAVRLLTCGIDIQKDEAWVHVHGWGANTKESFLVDAFVVPCPEGYDLGDALAPVLERTYQTVDGRTLKVWATAVDSGHRAHDVYDFAMAHRGRNVYPVKGQSGTTRGVHVSPTLIDTFSDGRKRPHGVQLLNIDTDVFKTVVMGAIKASAAKDDAAQAVRVDGIDGTRAEDLGVNHRLRLPVDCPDVVRSHWTSERRQLKSATRRAHAKYTSANEYEWVRLAGRRNEYLDTFVYQVALVGFKQLGRYGMLQMDQLNAALVSPERVARPLAGLEDRLKDIRAMRRRR